MLVFSAVNEALVVFHEDEAAVGVLVFLHQTFDEVAAVVAGAGVLLGEETGRREVPPGFQRPSRVPRDFGR